MMGEGDQEDRDEMKDISDMIDCIHFGGSRRKNIETVHYSEWISYRLIILCITIACLWRELLRNIFYVSGFSFQK